MYGRWFEDVVWTLPKHVTCSEWTMLISTIGRMKERADICAEKSLESQISQKC